MNQRSTPYSSNVVAANEHVDDDRSQLHSECNVVNLDPESVVHALGEVCTDV